MNRRLVPLILMLIAGAITTVMSFASGYSLRDKLLVLFLVLLIFYFLGSFIRFLLDYFDKQNAEREEKEGEVIEKEADSEEQGGEEHG